MKIVTIVGARPQFIKAAPVSRALDLRNRDHSPDGIREVVVHTGQHYDANMSDVFFEELRLRRPDYNLAVGSGTHGVQTGEILAGVERVLLSETPDLVVVYGDTNSTLAGALAAAKVHVPVAHVEAGLRSFNKKMPEEINRVLTDHVADLLLCPTETARENLRREGITKGVFVVGDVMYDAAMEHRELAERTSGILRNLALTAGGYALATVHRAENTDHPERLSNIVDALADIGRDVPVVWPVHPRTRKILGRDFSVNGLLLIEPVPYLDMLMLECSAVAVLTDSGGVQKEAAWYQVPCITLRDETEWVETLEAGRNTLAGANRAAIVTAFKKARSLRIKPLPAEGGAASRIAKLLFQ
jgi:UDP-GlcNAc3NAcA epimerase